jgi:hypothetical protein
MPVDVWVDSDNRVVKMHISMSGGLLGGDSGGLDMTTEITDFDVPVDVQAPPEDQVTDFSTLFDQFLGPDKSQEI